MTGGRPSLVMRQTVRQRIGRRRPHGVRTPSAKPAAQARRPAPRGCGRSSARPIRRGRAAPGARGDAAWPARRGFWRPCGGRRRAGGRGVRVLEHQFRCVADVPAVVQGPPGQVGFLVRVEELVRPAADSVQHRDGQRVPAAEERGDQPPRAGSPTRRRGTCRRWVRPRSSATRKLTIPNFGSPVCSSASRLNTSGLISRPSSSRSTTRSRSPSLRSSSRATFRPPDTPRLSLSSMPTAPCGSGGSGEPFPMTTMWAGGRSCLATESSSACSSAGRFPMVKMATPTRR